MQDTTSSPDSVDGLVIAVRTTLILTLPSENPKLALTASMKNTLLKYSTTARHHFADNPTAIAMELNDCGPVGCTEDLLRLHAVYNRKSGEAKPIMLMQFINEYSVCFLIGLYESAIGLRLKRNVLHQSEADIYRVIMS